MSQNSIQSTYKFSLCGPMGPGRISCKRPGIHAPSEREGSELKKQSTKWQRYFVWCLAQMPVLVKIWAHVHWLYLPTSQLHQLSCRHTFLRVLDISETLAPRAPLPHQTMLPNPSEGPSHLHQCTEVLWKAAARCASQLCSITSACLHFCDFKAEISHRH